MDLIPDMYMEKICIMLIYTTNCYRNPFFTWNFFDYLYKTIKGLMTVRQPIPSFFYLLFAIML